VPQESRKFSFAALSCWNRTTAIRAKQTGSPLLGDLSAVEKGREASVLNS
jgi:hypothetical protein